MSRRAAVLAAGSTTYAILLVLTRGRPTLSGDTGVFLSVGARLLRGDRLYAGVWDNKDPFFYYSYAAALKLGGWRGPFLLDIVWVGVAAASIWLLLRFAGATRFVAAVGFIMYPLLLTGAWYYAGDSETAPLALAPVVCWLWMRGSAWVAGVVLALALMFRLDYALVFVSLLIAPALVGFPRVGRRRRAVQTALAFFGALAVALLVLAERGELLPYFHTMVGNVHYANNALAERDQSGVIGHLSRAWDVLGPAHALLLVSVTLAGFALAARVLLSPYRRPRDASMQAPEPKPTVTIAALFIGSAAATVITLALTFLWDHHFELTTLPGALLCALVVAKIETAPSTVLRFGATLLLLTITAEALGGLPQEQVQGPPRAGGLSAWVNAPTSATADALNTVRARKLADFPVVTYTHLGSNDEDGAAEFLARQFKLACPVFQEYVFSTNLNQALLCLEEKRPELVLETASFQYLPGKVARAWNAFVTRGRRLLRDDYTRTLVSGRGAARIEVWRRRNPS